MSPTTRRILLVLGFVFLGGVFATLLMPEGFRRLDMYSESDGRRQRDWKYFGFIPYSTIEMDKSLHVTDDFWKELEHSQLKVDPLFRRAKPDFLIRSFYTRRDGTRHRGSYYGRSTVDGDFSALESFYFSQLKGTPGKASPKDVFKMGTLPNGKEIMIQIRTVGPGKKRGTDKIELAVQLFW